MEKELTKAQVIERLTKWRAEDGTETEGPSKKIVAKILDDLAWLAYDEIKTRGKFTVPGFGKLILQDRAARVGRNPMTGAPVQIPARRVVKFRVSKTAKEAILGTSTPPGDTQA